MEDLVDDAPLVKYKLVTSWYEFILDREKLYLHLKRLCEDVNAEPTAFQLISTFLEKAGAIEGQTSISESSVDKRNMLVQYALFFGSFTQWKLKEIQQNVLPAVQYSLFKELKEWFPLRSKGISNDNSSFSAEYLPLKTQDDNAVASCYLYCIWLLQFLTCTSLPDSQLSLSETTTFASKEDISSIINPAAWNCVKFLEDFIMLNQELHLSHVSLPDPVAGLCYSEIKAESHYTAKSLSLPKSQLDCEAWYTIGVFYFQQEKFTKALYSFEKATACYGDFASFSKNELDALMLACGSLLMEDSIDAKMPLPLNTVLLKVEEVKRNHKLEEISSILIKDNINRKLSISYRQSLEKYIEQLLEENESKEPSSKRQKLDNNTDLYSIYWKVCVFNALLTATNEQPIANHHLKLLKQGSDSNFQFMCESLVYILKNSSNRECRLLKKFVEFICAVSGSNSVLINQLRSSTFSTLFKGLQLQPERNSFIVQKCPTSLSDLSFCHSSAEDKLVNLSELERKISSTVTYKALLQAITAYFESRPKAEHELAAKKWTGVGFGLATYDQITSHVIQTKYNVLIHRALQARNAEECNKAMEFYKASLWVVGQKSNAIPQKTKSTKEPYLHEQILTMEIKHELQLSTGEKSDNVYLLADILSLLELARISLLKSSVLVDKTKAYYNQSKTDKMLNSHTIQLATAFLLNYAQFSFLGSSGTGTPLSKQTDIPQISSRLADAVLHVQKQLEIRKPIRDLFETVSGTFIPSPGSSDSRGDLKEKYINLRSHFAMFIDNLKEPTCLSLLLAAFGRLWKLMSKTQEDLTSEFPNHWPTAVSSNTSEVYTILARSYFQRILQQSIQEHPDQSLWHVMQADYFYVCSDYAAAMKCYIIAGAINSMFFVKDVSAIIWSQQTYQRMIECCQQLFYRTYALILTQCLVPVDYELAFKIIKTSGSDDGSETCFWYIWDASILEYLINTLNKQGEFHKKSLAVKAAGQPEININNDVELLDHAIELRKRNFFRVLFMQLL